MRAPCSPTPRYSLGLESKVEGTGSRDLHHGAAATCVLGLRSRSAPRGRTANITERPSWQNHPLVLSHKVEAQAKEGGEEGEATLAVSAGARSLKLVLTFARISEPGYVRCAPLSSELRYAPICACTAMPGTDFLPVLTYTTMSCTDLYYYGTTDFPTRTWLVY
eukprot:3923085-Rhodomonas_salina.1